MGGQVLELKTDKWWGVLQDIRKYAREVEKSAEEMERSTEEGEINCLNEWLAEAGRVDDIIRAAKDPVFREEMIQAYRMAKYRGAEGLKLQVNKLVVSTARYGRIRSDDERACKGTGKACARERRAD